MNIKNVKEEASNHVKKDELIGKDQEQLCADFQEIKDRVKTWRKS